MSKCDVTARVLPDVEMYGGDTTPWVVSLMADDTHGYTGSIDGMTCALSISASKQLNVTNGVAEATEPLVELTGTLAMDASGARATFNFARSDTLNLRGKYVYQISLIKNNDERVCQGNLYIRQNINRWQAVEE